MSIFLFLCPWSALQSHLYLFQPPLVAAVVFSTFVFISHLILPSFWTMYILFRTEYCPFVFYSCTSSLAGELLVRIDIQIWFYYFLSCISPCSVENTCLYLLIITFPCIYWYHIFTVFPDDPSTYQIRSLLPPSVPSSVYLFHVLWFFFMKTIPIAHCIH